MAHTIRIGELEFNFLEAASQDDGKNAVTLEGGTKVLEYTEDQPEYEYIATLMDKYVALDKHIQEADHEYNKLTHNIQIFES